MRTTAAAALLALVTAPAWAEGETHYLAVHVDENDPQVMNMALNNVANVRSYYAEQGDEVLIEVVAYGPGLFMFLQDSPVRPRIEEMSLGAPEVRFAACGNTLRNMSERAGHEIEILPEAEVVPSGVVRLIELQEQGYAYVRP
ncbi:hypothetical protein HKCCE2091_02475 [Rhodobacterales bacterium HKCCE2091]|nr:hypothetical protein [Rhodobacterales bacterium HKCCE2091]